MAKPSTTYAGDPALIAIGKAIRKSRLTLNLSQESLALSADLDRSYMGGIERGEHNLTIMNLLKISTVLKLQLSELVARANY